MLRCPHQPGEHCQTCFISRLVLLSAQAIQDSNSQTSPPHVTRPQDLHPTSCSHSGGLCAQWMASACRGHKGN